jgi:hypothetical protein
MPAVGSDQAQIFSSHVSLVLGVRSYRLLPTFICQNHRTPRPKANPSAPQVTYHADGHVHRHVPHACCQPTGLRAVPAIRRATFASEHALNRPPPPVRSYPRPPLRLLGVVLSIIVSPTLLVHAALSHGHDTDRPPPVSQPTRTRPRPCGPQLGLVLHQSPHLQPRCTALRRARHCFPGRAAGPPCGCGRPRSATAPRSPVPHFTTPKTSGGHRLKVHYVTNRRPRSNRSPSCST